MESKKDGDGISSLVLSTLREQCKLCQECINIYVRGHSCGQKEREEVILSTEQSLLQCPACLDLFSPLTLHRISHDIQSSMTPYGGIEQNHVSKDIPTVTLPAVMTILAHAIIATVENILQEHYPTVRLDSVLKITSARDALTSIKDLIRMKIRDLIVKGESSSNLEIDLPRSLQNEEAGYLNYHVVFTAPPTLALAPNHILPLPSLNTKRERKRFRGNDPVDKQGGDPRVNLEKRVKAWIEKSIKAGSTDNNIKNETEWFKYLLMDKNSILQLLEGKIGNELMIRKQLYQWMGQELHPNLSNEKYQLGFLPEGGTAIKSIGVHVSCWRNHFYVKGRYTKSRRDISQTPFFVPNTTERSDSEDKQRVPRMIKKGISSVEEEICPLLARVACGGISDKNNEPGQELKNGKTDDKGKIVYGMAKFHASGREDMDVRMVLPLHVIQNELELLKKDSPGKGNAGSSTIRMGTGRPFVSEVIDAHRIPSQDDLEKAVLAINHLPSGSIPNYILQTRSIFEREWIEEQRQFVQYGMNPNGVGVSSLTLCEASCFKNLQSETEDKIKFYGCLCWSEKDIPDQHYLDEKLKSWDDTKEHSGTIYPLEIYQSTPLRVLHRRAAGIRVRHVISLTAKRIDNNWFRLHLSTSAGTYVKEFVHGDCGRTKPSVSSLLQCKTDILELDCEGIAS